MNDITTPKNDVITIELPASDYEAVANTFKDDGYDILTLPLLEGKILRQLKISHPNPQMLSDAELQKIMRKIKNKTPMPTNTRNWGRKRSPY